MKVDPALTTDAGSELELRGQPQQDASAPADRIHVLHVDDESGLLTMTRRILEISDPSLEFETISSPMEALKLLEEKRFDCIVSDYQMPGMDGIEFARRIRERSGLPIIIYTGRGSEEVAEAAFAAGVDDYLRKELDPAHYQVLVKRIRTVVEKHRAEKSLMESERRYKSLVEESRDGILVFTGEECVFANQQAAVLHGCDSVEELMKITTSRLLHPDDREYVEERFLARQRGEDIPPITEFRYVLPDGTVRTVQSSSSVIQYNGKPSTLAFIRDITDRKQMEEELKRSEKKYRSLFESTREGIIVSDSEGRIQSANQAAAEIHGCRRPEEMLGMSAVECYTDPERRKAVFEELMEKGYVTDAEIVIRRKDGENRIILASFTLHKDEAGNILRTEVMMRDITERKQMEEDLENLAKFPSEDPNPMIRIAEDGTIMYANSAAESLLSEWSCEEGQAAPVQWRDMVSEALKRYQGREVEITCSDRVTSFVLAPVTDAGYVNVYGRDITKRKRMEDELKWSERSLAEAQRIAHMGNWDLDIVNNNLYWSDEIYRIFGLEPQQFGATYEAFLVWVHPEDRERVNEAVQEAINENTSYSIEHRIVLPSGEVRIVREEAEVTSDDSGKSIRMIGTVQDITERKKAAEKLNVVGKLTRHDVRNKLSLILNNLYLAKRKLGEGDEALTYLEEVKDTCDSIVNILDFASEYEKLGREELKPIDAGESFRTAQKMLNTRGIDVENRCNGLKVCADSLLSRVFYNLIDNTLKHGGEVSKIRIYPGKAQLQVIYEDDGVGIPPENKQKIFGQKKMEFHGLHLIQSIINSYGGTISEEGKPGEGVKFVITFPMHKKGISEGEKYE